MTASGLYWLVYEMYRYQAGKISFIKIRNRSAWNKNILYQIFIYICAILVFWFFGFNNWFMYRFALRSKEMAQLFFEWRPLGIDCSLKIERLVLFQDTFMFFLLWNFRNGVYTPKAGVPDVKQAATSKLNENLATFKKLEPCTRKKFYLTVYFS